MAGPVASVKFSDTRPAFPLFVRTRPARCPRSRWRCARSTLADGAQAESAVALEKCAHPLARTPKFAIMRSFHSARASSASQRGSAAPSQDVFSSTEW